MKGAHYLFKPLNVDQKGTLDVAMYEQYLVQSFWPSQLDIIILNPLEKALKGSSKIKHDAGDFVLKISEGSTTSTSWKQIYEKLKTFVEIRSDDSRAEGLPDLKYKPGIGYCISIESLLKEIEDRIDEFTSTSTYPLIGWPRSKKSDPPVRDVVLPELDYLKITPEALRVGLQVRRFKNSLEEEVIKAYKTANERWIKEATAYDRENIPSKEISPVTRFRHVGDLRYIAINLVREDKPNYQAVIDSLVAELKALQQGQRGEIAELYRATQDDFVNIKRLGDRLENLFKDTNHNKVDVRYEIKP